MRGMTRSLRGLVLAASLAAVGVASAVRADEPNQAAIAPPTMTPDWVQLPDTQWFIHATTLNRNGDTLRTEVLDLRSNRYGIFDANCQSGSVQLVYMLNMNNAQITVYRPGSNQRIETEAFQRSFSNFACNLPLPTATTETPSASSTTTVNTTNRSGFNVPSETNPMNGGGFNVPSESNALNRGSFNQAPTATGSFNALPEGNSINQGSFNQSPSSVTRSSTVRPLDTTSFYESPPIITPSDQLFNRFIRPIAPYSQPATTPEATPANSEASESRPETAPANSQSAEPRLE